MRRALYSFIALLASTVPVATAGPSDREENRGCGVDSLYHLLRCEGRSPTLERVQAILPRPQARGHSFADVRRAAEDLGLTLDAVALRRTETSIDRPMLMFFRIDGDGHFAVVKPVGHTGRLVQVIDGDRSPTVLNFGDLARLPSWTGLALAPRRMSVSRLAFLSGGAVASAWALRRRRSTRPVFSGG